MVIFHSYVNLPEGKPPTDFESQNSTYPQAFQVHQDSDLRLTSAAER